MSLTNTAKVNYNDHSTEYKNLYDIRKKLTEIYTSLKYLQEARSSSCSGLKILELGCGNGEFMLEALSQDAEYVSGMDLSDSMIISAENLLNQFPKSKYSLRVGNAFEPSALLSQYSHNEFSNIIANWLIGYAESPEVLGEFFASCRAILRPGGRIFGIFLNESVIDKTQESMEKMHSITSRHEIIQVFNDYASSKIYFLNPENGEDLFQVESNIFKKQCIRRLLEENGFEVLKISPLEYSDEIYKYGFTPGDFRAYTEEIGMVYCFLAVSLGV